MIFRFSKIIFFTIAILSMWSCGNTRYLSDSETLFTGYKLKVEKKENDHKIGSVKTVMNEAKDVLFPEPNKTFLGLKIKLWFYNISNDSIESKGFKGWVNRKLGEPPVLITDVDFKANRDRIDAVLFNNGHFESYSGYEVIVRKKKAKVVFTANLTPPYRIKEITSGVKDVVLNSWITKSETESILKVGNIYKLDDIKQEKTRLVEFLKNKGYYFLKEDYLIYEVDTNSSEYNLHLKLILEKTVPNKAKNIYRIGDVTINKNYSVSEQQNTFRPVVFDTDTFLLSDDHQIIRDKAILRSVLLKPGEVYALRNHENTLGQFMGMGVFKFVNIRYQEDSIPNAVNPLEVRIDLTLLPKRTLTGEVEVVSKSNNYFGPGLNLYLKNRNAFGGAELLIYNLSSSFESQISGGFDILNSFEIGPSVELIFPKFVVPFKVKKFGSNFVPKTHITLGYKFLSRKDFFNLTSLNLAYGFKWKETLAKSHELIPLSLNYVRISNKSASFQEMLDNNLLLQKSFEEQFLAGLKYFFTYNELLLNERKNQSYFQGRLETSGNAFSLVSRLLDGRKPDSDNPAKIAGEIYAQFVKVDGEFRYYINLGKSHKLVSRIYGGVGVAYGNSETLPYIVQFFSGGSSGLRGFPARSVGPGINEPNTGSQSFYEQGGDIKLEWNEELRFSITKLVKWAFFADAGNIWLLKNNESIPGGTFTDRFYKDIAVSGGTGLRLDIGFFVLRFDLGIPFRKPWLPDEEKWVLNKFNFGSGSWRSDNMILNLAIGYPF